MHESVANLAALAQMATIIRPDRTTGQERRFRCKCGLNTPEPEQAMMHLFASLEERSPHDVVTERFSLGRWHFDRHLSKEALNRLRRKGESVGEFAQRMTSALRTATDTLERMEAE